MQADREFLTKTRKQRRLCAWLIVVIKRGSGFEEPVAAHVHGREGKMTKWFLKRFKRLLNYTVLNLFLICRQVTERNIEQFSYGIQLVEISFTKYSRAVETQSVPGDRHPTTQLHDGRKDIFWEKWHPKLKTQNLRGGVLCAQSTEKRKLQCTAAKCATWVFAGNIALSLSHEAQLLS